MEPKQRKNLLIAQFSKGKKTYQFYESSIRIFKKEKRAGGISYQKMKKVRKTSHHIVVSFAFPRLPLWIPMDIPNSESLCSFLESWVNRNHRRLEV